MRDKALFVGASLAVSLALFALIWWMTMAHVYVPEAIGFLVPALSVMACARGVGLRRKTIAIALTLFGFTLFDLIAQNTGLAALARRPLTGGFEQQAVTAVGLLYAFVPLVYPLGALVLFVGRRPSTLWAPRVRAGSAPRKGSRTPG
jgi:hypothetical protein